MLFNSIEFSIFLPIVFILYWFVFGNYSLIQLASKRVKILTPISNFFSLWHNNLRIQNIFIVIVSYIFYGWWNWRFLILIFFTSICSWYSGILIEKWHNTPKAKLISGINILLNLSILGFFKYYNFFIESFAESVTFFGGHPDIWTLKIILPVGISFYTFQALSYSIDVYRRKMHATKDLVAFLAFVSFFPQLVAGPIERASNLLPQFYKKRKFDYDQAFDGLRQIVWGLFQKIVIADNCATYVNDIWNNYTQQTGSSLIVAAILFSFQIYGDFAGYSNIAIGTAKLFGIQLMRNFNLPYFSRNIGEFWRKWHISLTTWFKDYLYIPLGGSRVGKLKTIRNTFIIFLVSGFWHGANWTFVLWGAFHALLFMPALLTGKNRKYIKSYTAKGHWFPTFIETGQMLSTFMLATIGWIIFRAKNIQDAYLYFISCFKDINTIPYSNKLDLWYLLILIFVIFIPIEWISRGKKHGLDILHNKNLILQFIVIFGLIEIMITFYSHSTTFIYFQF